VALPSQKDPAGLLSIAAEARERAYAPYSHFRVGAAIACRDGTVFSGCNVENASYGLTVCAERVAVFTAVSNGASDFDAIALVTDTDEPVAPCGACRQVLAEFNPAIMVVMGTVKGKVRKTSLEELLPDPFKRQEKSPMRF
jgi:cytidine deaminase